MRHCDYCNREFTPKTHNQRYHSDECCRLATNKRIMERYYEKRDNRRGKERTCGQAGCETKLSRYNDEDHCSIHSGKETSSIANILKSLGVA